MFLAKGIKNQLRNIKKIGGYLVPGQEITLLKLAHSLKPKSNIVEIGSYLGKSTACLAYGSLKTTRIYAIDTFEGNKKDFTEGIQFSGGNYYRKFKNNMTRLGLYKKVKPIKGYSQKIGARWNKPIDLLFIDGSHVYKDVKKDFELFFPWVKPGGIVAFHDVHKNFPGVLKVWENNAKEKLSATSNDKTLYYGLKPSGKNKRLDKTRLKEIVWGKNHRVYVVIPVHNRLSYTKKCLNSIKNQTYKYIKVIVVDDGSTDGTSKFIKKRYPDYTLIKGDGNWWWSKSMYKGIEEALKTATLDDFVLSMNNDCIFNANYVRNIVKDSLKQKRGITGSLILDAKRSSRVIGAGVIIDWKNNQIYGLAERESNKLQYYKGKEPIKKINTLPGKGTLIPVEVFDKIGSFNYHLLPHYLADYEFFTRAKQHDIRLMVSTKSLLYNFAKQTGEYKKPGAYVGIRKSFFLLFGRKSKNNIFDYTLFVLLRSPKKYLVPNLIDVVPRFLSFLPDYHKMRIIIRRPFFVTPIYIKQNPLIKSIRRKFQDHS